MEPVDSEMIIETRNCKKCGVEYEIRFKKPYEPQRFEWYCWDCAMKEALS